MTEAEWLSGTDGVAGLLTAVWGRASPRQMRLFLCACARRVWEFLPDERARRAVEAAEAHAEGRIDDATLAAAHALAEAAYRKEAGRQALRRTSRAAHAAAAAVDASDAPLAFASLGTTHGPDALPFAHHVACAAGHAAWCFDGADAASRARRRAEVAWQCDALRELFGNPFRPVVVDAAWLRHDDGCVAKIARGIRGGRAFGHMPILADALLDAGCDEEELLTHCRSRAEHLPGCWALDLLLVRPQRSAGGMSIV